MSVSKSRSISPTEIFLHVLGWALYLLGFGVITAAEIEAYPETPWLFHWRGVLFAGLIFYAVYLVCIPVFLGKGKYTFFVLSMLALIFGYPALRTWLDFWLVDTVLQGPTTISFFIDGIQAGFEEASGEGIGFNFPAKPHAVSGTISYFSRLGLVIILILGASITRFSFDWFRNQADRGRLERERLNSEVSFLRSQVNPHFLFNTLNNIYFLTQRHPEQAPDAVLRLSELMRYMLYESNGPRVPLTTEIKQLRNFVALQRMRIRREDFVKLEIEGDPAGVELAPLLLIPFVENAFKHGGGKQDAGIDIRLKVGTEDLLFSVRNGFHVRETPDAVGGVGLNNVQRRLELLYPGKYTLEMQQEADIFSIQLEIVY